MLKLYRFISHLVHPLVWGLVHKRKLQGLEDPNRFRERLGLASIKRDVITRPLVWFHAASVGESISIIPVIHQIKTQHPDWDVLITTITVTSAKILQPHLTENIHHQYIPFDIPNWIERFLNTWRPNVMILMESELWPNTLSQVSDRNIPIVLLNARLSDRSYKRWCRFPKLIKNLLEKITHIYAQSHKVLHYMKSFGVDHVTLMTNLKYASPPLPFDPIGLERLQEMIQGRPIFLSVSTHKGEEEEIIKYHNILTKKIPNLLTIIVPRHPHRAPEIVKLFGDAPYALRSMSQSITDKTSFYLGDTIGELGLFFELSPFVFVGGSFLKSVAGHNPIEPALFGCAVIVGPHMENFSDIMTDFGNSITSVANADALAETVLQFIQNPETAESLGDTAQKIVDDKTNVVQEVISIIEASLQQGL